MPQAISPFTLDGFDRDPPYCEDGPTAYARARIAKTFTGDLEATSTVEMLSVTVAEVVLGVTVTPVSVTLPPGGQEQFEATVSFTCHQFTTP